MFIPKGVPIAVVLEDLFDGMIARAYFHAGSVVKKAIDCKAKVIIKRKFLA